MGSSSQLWSWARRARLMITMSPLYLTASVLQKRARLHRSVGWSMCDPKQQLRGSVIRVRRLMRAATRPEPVPPEGEEITLTVEQVTELIKVVQSLIRDIEVQQKELSE